MLQFYSKIWPQWLVPIHETNASTKLLADQNEFNWTRDLNLPPSAISYFNYPVPQQRVRCTYDDRFYFWTQYANYNVHLCPDITFTMRYRIVASDFQLQLDNRTIGNHWSKEREKGRKKKNETSYFSHLTIPI